MKKVSELIGAELDYWVAKAEGFTDVFIEDGMAGSFDPEDTIAWDHHRFSFDWDQGGEIIAREGITIEAIWPVSGSLPVNTWHAERNGINYQFGKTPLIAAMRCFVSSRLGDEVDDSQTHNL